jgi:5'-deoxynucleotidase YfbR-like HD superfamily hydrolase
MNKTKPTFEDIERVLREIVIPFYQIDRAIPLRFRGRSWENDAEHSWSVALVACMLAPHIDPKLDIGKICQFAVIHDLVELYAGDTNVYGPEEHHETKEEREQEALQKLAKEFAHLPWLTETLAAYEAQDTPEALYVRSIDKYVALLFDYVDDGQYYRDHKLTRERFLKDIQRPRKKAMGHTGAFEYHEEAMRKILDRPGFFHQDDEKTTK